MSALGASLLETIEAAGPVNLDDRRAVAQRT
ncbi:hypothetical protein BH24ACI5_BH24ACI5_08940 [soil metagenome]